MARFFYMLSGVTIGNTIGFFFWGKHPVDFLLGFLLGLIVVTVIDLLLE